MSRRHSIPLDVSQSMFNMEMLIINIKYIAANELNSLIRLVNHELAASSDKSYPNIKHHESTSYYCYY